MKENWGDKVVKGVEERLNKVTDILGEQLKDTRPFDKDPVDINDTYFHYRNLTPMDMQYLIGKHGEDRMEEFLFEMSKFEKDKRRSLNGGQ